MKAAIATLRDIDTNGRRVAVLGDMAELGMMAELAHFKVGEDLGRGGVDVLVTVGARAARIGDGARATGMSADAVHGTDDADEALQAVRALLAPGDVVLVKASRIMGLETIVEGVTST